MLGKSHLFYGLTAGAALSLALSHPLQPATVIETAVMAGFAALLPDLDEPGSTISNAPRILGRTARRLLRHTPGLLGLRLLALLAGVLVGTGATALNVVSRTLSHLVRLVAGGHREGTHWLPIWALLSASVFVLTAPLAVVAGGPYLGTGFCIGYLSHLASDGCTRSGIPLVPHGTRRLHLLPRFLRIRTGSAGETAFTVIYAVALVVAVSVTRSPSW